MDKEFEEWWTINKFLLMHDESVGLREIARAGYEAGKNAAQKSLHTDPPTAQSFSVTCPICRTFIGVDFAESAGGESLPSETI